MNQSLRLWRCRVRRGGQWNRGGGGLGPHLQRTGAAGDPHAAAARRGRSVEGRSMLSGRKRAPTRSSAALFTRVRYSGGTAGPVQTGRPAARRPALHAAQTSETGRGSSRPPEACDLSLSLNGANRPDGAALKRHSKWPLNRKTAALQRCPEEAN